MWVRSGRTSGSTGRHRWSEQSPAGRSTDSLQVRSRKPTPLRSPEYLSGTTKGTPKSGSPSRCEPACKPDPVEDDHLSGAAVTERPRATYPERIGRAALFLLGLAPDGVYLAVPVTRHAGGLLPHRFTLACITDRFRSAGEGLPSPNVSPVGRHAPSAVCSLLHCPSGCPAWVLPSVMPCGVRTFLDRHNGRDRLAGSQDER